MTRPWLAGRIDGPRGADDSGIDLRELLAIVRRRRTSILAVTVAIILLTLLYLLAVKPTYTAVVEILLDPSGQRITEKGLLSEGAPPDGGTAFAESQLRIVQSESVLHRVVAAEHLASDPEFAGERNLPIPAALRAALAFFGQSGSRQETNELRALRRLRDAVTSKHSGKALVVDVLVSSHGPQKAARLANAVAEAYLVNDSNARAEAAIEAAKALTSHLSELGEQVRQADESVQRYKFQHNTLAAPNEPVPLSTNEALVGLRELERKAEVDRAIYQSFLLRARQTAADGALTRTNARIISRAVAPIRPGWPPALALLGLALALGLGLGTGMALAQDYFDNSIHTRRQLEASCHHVVLATIPALKPKTSMPLIVKNIFHAATEPTGADTQFLRLRDSLRRAAPPAVTPQKDSNRKRQSRLPGGPGTILLITSSGRAQGTSTVATNLALASMRDGERVLLVDADFRNCAISNHLTAKPMDQSTGDSTRTVLPGLNDILNGLATFETSLLCVVPERLAVLPAGSAEGAQVRGEGAELIDRIFSKALQFDLTIIDCGDAPSNRFVRSLATVAHQIVLVVKAGATRATDIEFANLTLSDAPTGIRGIILNAVHG